MRFHPLAAAFVFFSASLAAHADSFSFTFGTTASAFSGSGLFTTGSMIAPGEYTIASVTGTVETEPNGINRTIASILDPGVFPTVTNGNSFPANDNTLFVFNGVGTLSQDGVSFVLGNGAQINLYNGGTGNDAFLDRANGTTLLEKVPITIAAAVPVAATPEPSSLALLGTGLMGLVSLVRRRAQA